MRHVISGDDLSEATIDEMWSLRARLFRLKPECSPKIDRVSFGKRVRMGQKNLLLRDPDGVLRGMLSIHWRPSVSGRQVWLLPEYGFLDRAYRGHPAFAYGCLRVFLSVLREARFRNVWLAGIGYPRSFQSIARVMPEHYTLADAHVPEEAREVLLYLHETFAGERWDRATHRVWMPTIPEPRPPDPVSEVWARYESICPNWPDGYALGLAARLDWWLPIRALREVAVRSRLAPRAPLVAS